MHNRAPFVAVVLALLLGARVVAAQVGSSTDIITGKITGPDGRPIPGARVDVKSVETEVTHSKTTNDKGQYTLLFPDGGGQYTVTVHAIGLAPATFSLARQADEDRLVGDVQMVAAATTLSAVIVRARNPGAGGGDRPSPGDVQRALTGEQLARLPIDPSDPNAVALLQPGVIGIAGTDTTAAAFSVAGQRPDQNQVTLDGLSFNDATVPQEAIRSTRVITNTYDVARGQFTGGVVATTTRGGTNMVSGSASYALRDPHLEFAADQATPTTFGSSYTQHQFSAGVGGPIVRDKAFWFGALQLRLRDDPLQTITAANALTLQRLGADPDSTSRFLQLTQGFGVPLTMPVVPDSRASTNGNGIVRFDYQVDDDNSLMVRGNWQGAVQDAFRTSALALPTHGGRSGSSGGGAMLQLSSVVGQFINEGKASYTRTLNSADPYLDTPEGRVRVTSVLADSTVSVTNFDLGGNTALPSDGTSDQFEGTDELSWLSEDGAHRVKLGSLLNVSDFASLSSANRNGAFTFNSLADFAANRPATFTRALVARERTGGALNAAIYLGDTWRRSRALQVTYGARIEGSDFRGRPLYNPHIDSLFGRRTDLFPSEVHLSPRVGFTWSVGQPPANPRGGNPSGGPGGGPGGGFGGFGGFGGGRGGFGGPRFGGNANQFGAPWILRGGIGEFRGRAPTQLFQSAIDATGLPGAETQLLCVGNAVPVPDWAAYDADPSTIPTQCADGSTPNPVFSSQKANVTVFSPDFVAPRSWRGSFGVSKRFLTRFNASVDASYALGTHLYGVEDLNLDPNVKFRLADEDNRPVFVSTSAIFPATGAVSLVGSRRSSLYGQVFNVSSDLESRTSQVTVSLGGINFTNFIWNAAYTYTRSTDESSFSGGSAAGGFASATTAGDPNPRQWGTSDLQRTHAIVGSITWLAKPWIDVTSVIRFTSGAPFTPRVGSDINGDGARNDRAFVFSPDPTVTRDTAVANGMARLLATAPATARDCLEAQIGQISARNSCNGVWQPTLDFQANLRPDLGKTIGRRLNFMVSAIDPLAGLDQLLHGSNNLHGWGQPSRPDPTLLYVRGFDPLNQRFIYEVNQRFGDNPASRTAIRQPFMIGLQGRYQIGPDRQRELLEARLRALSAGPNGIDMRAIVNRVAPNPVLTIIELKDTLQLTPAQITSLQTIADTLSAQNEVLIKDLEDQRAKATNGGDLAAIFPAIQPRLQQARNNYLAAVQKAQKVLTPAQWNKLPDAVRNPRFQRGPGGGGRRGGPPLE